MFKKEWLLTCAPIGILELSKQAWKAVASGVFIYDNPFIWYVTSYQQICSNRDVSLNVLLRHKKMGQILFDISSIHKQEKIGWVFDEKNNIAATLFPSDPDLELKAVGFESFLDSQDMLPAMNCYSIGFPYALAEQDSMKIGPSVLEGIISRIDEPSKVYITTPIFLDNYGCPLFVWKNPVGLDGSVNLGQPSLYLGGIMTKTVSMEKGVCNNDKHALQSIHMGVMSSSELIKNLLFSSEGVSQKKRLKEKNPI